MRVRAGSYPGGTIPSLPNRRGPKVVFKPARGAHVTVKGELTVRASYLELRAMTLKDLELPQDADHVTFRNVRNNGFWMQGPSHITFLGGEVTCGVCPFHSLMDQSGSPNHKPPTWILFDRVRFYDWHSQAGEHTECLQILSGDHVTIRNSVFRHCGTANGGLGATADLHISWIGTGPVTRNIRLENNFFYPSGNPFAIQMDDLANLDLRYNSIAGPVIIFDRAGPGTGMDFIGNVMTFSGCTAEGSGVAINWRHNVTSGGTCGATDLKAPSGFLSRTRNLHLKADAAAVNRGDPASYPRRDIDGQQRPKGARPDAGADERR